VKKARVCYSARNLDRSMSLRLRGMSQGARAASSFFSNLVRGVASGDPLKS
jgi:hypothetical protein